MSGKQHTTGTSNALSEQDITGFSRQIIDSSPSSMLLVDVQADDMPIVYVNAAFETLTGYASDEAIGRNCRFLQGNDRIQPDLDVLRQALNNKETCTVTLRNYRKDGTLFWNELRIWPIFGADGQMTHFVSMQNDVTERKRATEALRDSEALYTHMMNHLPDVIVLYDADLRFLFVNVEGQRRSGYPQSHFFGKTDEDVFPPEITQDYMPLLRKAQSTGEVQTAEIDFELPSGSYTSVVTYVPITNEQGDVKNILGLTQDITKRKQAEESLRKSEEHYRLLTEHSHDLIALHEPDGTIIYASPSFERALGFTLDEMRNITPGDTVHPDDIMLGAQMHQRILEQKTTVEFDYRLKKKDGDYVWVNSFSKPILDEHGEIMQLLAVSRDITERKQMEEDLARSMTDLKLAQRIASIGNWTFDPEVGVPVWSDEVYRIYERDPQFGPPSLEDYRKIYAAPYFDRFWIAIQAAISEGKPYDIKLNLSLPGGKQKWIHAICEPEPDKGPAGHLLRGTIQDVSETHFAQEALRESEERFRQLTENIEAAFWLIDIETSEYLYISPAYDAIWQRSRLELMEKGVEAFIPTLYPEDRDWAMRSVSEWITKSVQADTISPKEATYKIEHRIIRPSGEIRSVETKYFLVRNQSGDFYRIAVITQDITERKQAEQHEFELALERERRQLLTSFIQDAAHEFRTPLATINSSTHLMSRYEDPEKRADKVERVQNQVHRITRLVDMLLLMTKLESGDALAMVPVDLQGIMQEVMQDMGARCDKNHQIQWNVPPELPRITGNAVLLSEAFRQVIENACRFTPQGGTITLTAQTDDQRVAITVQDAGPGIAADDLPHIFETFWRQDSAHSTPGFGLGLPIAQKIIERHGGKITVNSEPGKGSKFILSLPHAMIERGSG